MPLVLPFTSDPSQSFTVPLGGPKFLIEARYNDLGAMWTFDITTEPAQVVLAVGIPLLIGQDMLSSYALGIGGLIASDTQTGGIDAGPDDLGDRVIVAWFSEAELAILAANGANL